MASGDGVLTSPTLLRELRDPGQRERAWRTFLERYRPLIANWCFRAGLGRDDADEVSAAVLAKLVTVMSTFEYDPARRFRCWLRTVVQNEVHALWRQRARRRGDWGSGDPHIHSELEKVEAPGCMEDLVQALDETLERDLRHADQAIERVTKRVAGHTWRAYWLTAIEDEPAGEVARKLGMKVAAVYVAKKRVGRMLREEGLRLQAQAGHGKGVHP
jgi:RNA polymerase sigma-70 factor (ECF subfamily)